ncbi:MAG: CBS domain-containing protein [Bacteroidales bacterium]|nr:CBS domain-containing protein [Bacteroidales bacterium]
MLAKELASENIPLVTGSDSVSQVIKYMTEFRVAHLPVVDHEEYLGMISENEITEIANPDQTIDLQSIRLLMISVVETQHVYEVIDLISTYNLTLLPVLTIDKKYSGCITIPVLIKQFRDLTAAGEPGAIFELNFAVQDYSPTLLSRMIEDNHAKILSLYVVTDPNGRDVTVTVKINTQETSSIMRSFERYGLSVKSTFLTNSQLDDFYRSRYEELMKYMNI